MYLVICGSWFHSEQLFDSDILTVSLRSWKGALSHKPRVLNPAIRPPELPQVYVSALSIIPLQYFFFEVLAARVCVAMGGTEMKTCEGVHHDGAEVVRTIPRISNSSFIFRL
jgi:hypothetical protein